MQRATKEDQATATVDPRWPFQMKTKESKDKEEEAEKKEKTNAELKEEIMKREMKKTHIDEFVSKLKDPFKRVVEPWPSWEAAKATTEGDESSPHYKKPRNKDGKTECYYYMEKMERCTEAIPDLTPRHKTEVEDFVKRFTPMCATMTKEEVKLVTAVDIDASSTSQGSAPDTESDEEGLAGISAEMQAEVRENREKINCWLMSHRALYGKSQAHKAKLDAWEQLIAFDTTGSCILVRKDKKGNSVPADITEGLNQANRSGASAAEELTTVMTRCMSCDIKVTTGGDKAILRCTSEGGQYQCEKCFINEYEQINDGKTLSKTSYKKLAINASGRSHMSVKKIARSALFKITKDMYGSSSSETGRR